MRQYVRLLDERRYCFTEAAHAVGVSKRTGKAWRNGRTRHGERNLVDWYRPPWMTRPSITRYLSREGASGIADRLRLGDSIAAIARLLGRDPALFSREVERSRVQVGGCRRRASRNRRPAPSL